MRFTQLLARNTRDYLSHIQLARDEDIERNIAREY